MKRKLVSGGADSLRSRPCDGRGKFDADSSFVDNFYSSNRFSSEAVLDSESFKSLPLYDPFQRKPQIL